MWPLDGIFQTCIGNIAIWRRDLKTDRFAFVFTLELTFNGLTFVQVVFTTQSNGYVEFPPDISSFKSPIQ